MKKNYENIRALRAIAALMVVLYHITVLWQDRWDYSSIPWEYGNAGVDLFFVISGFIMVVSSRHLWGTEGAASIFMRHRLARIVPLYWIVTAFKIIGVLTVPALALHTSLAPLHVLASFAFVPDGTLPVVPVGWTLTFEMVFYMAFALALWTRRPPVMLVSLLMFVVAAFAAPIVAEFVFGMFVGLWVLAVQQRRLVASWAGLLLIVGGFGLMLTARSPMASEWSRVLHFGWPAFLIVFGAVWCDGKVRVPRALGVVGDASYSLYLTHGFVLPIVGAVALRFGWHWPLFAAGCVVGSVAAAVVCFYTVERPLTRALRRWADGRSVEAVA